MEKVKNNQGKVIAKDNQKSAKKPKWSLKKKIIVIVGAILTFIIVLIAIVSMSTSAPLAVSDAFVKDIQAVNASSAYDMMSNDAQTATSSADFAMVVDQIGPILTGEPKLKEKEISAETGNNATAEIIYEVKGNDDITYELSVQLIEQDGDWKVQGFNSERK